MCVCVCVCVIAGTLMNGFARCIGHIHITILRRNTHSS